MLGNGDLYQAARHGHLYCNRSKAEQKNHGREPNSSTPSAETLPEEESEVLHRNHESWAGCGMISAAYMESTWSLVQRYGTKSFIETGLNRPLLYKILKGMHENAAKNERSAHSFCHRWEANSPIKLE